MLVRLEFGSDKAFAVQISGLDERIVQLLLGSGLAFAGGHCLCSHLAQVVLYRQEGFAQVIQHSCGGGVVGLGCFVKGVFFVFVCFCVVVLVIGRVQHGVVFIVVLHVPGAEADLGEKAFGRSYPNGPQ